MTSAAHDLERGDERAAHARMPDVAHDADLEAVARSRLCSQMVVQVEKRLGGMLVLAVARVDRRLRARTRRR